MTDPFTPCPKTVAAIADWLKDCAKQKGSYSESLVAAVFETVAKGVEDWAFFKSLPK